MKRICIISLLFFSGLLYTGEEKKVDSKVVAATVFKDRAMVTRSAEINLAKGIHTLTFSNLTNDLQSESVRLSASGPGIIKILDIQVERRFTTEIQHDKIRRLQDKIDSLTVYLQITMDQLAVYESKKSFVEALKAESLKYMNQKMLVNPTSSKEWNEMLLFVETNLNNIYKGMRRHNQEKNTIESQIKAIQLEMNQATGGRSRSYKDINVKIECSATGAVELNPSYIVTNANWYPLYDARVSSRNKEIELSYYAMVVQSTGEDWRDIQLTFSTADPMSMKSLPELERWFLSSTPMPYQDQKLKPSSRITTDYKITYEQNWGLAKGKGAVTGYVTDNTTGEPLAGANVFLQSTNMGSVTDKNGKFYMANIAAGRYTLEAQMIGFQTVNINMDVEEKHVANIVIPINQSVLESEAITVTAEKMRTMKDQTSAVRSRGGRSDEVRYFIDGINTGEGTDKKERSVKMPEYTNIYAREISTIFELKTNNSIPSDNTPHKVTIAIDPLPIEFEYTAIPKKVPAVYLKGKVVNQNSYPLLEGELNVFVDNDFINRTALTTIVPSDTLELALGIDDNITCERVLINKFRESKGLLSGSTQITYEYEIQVANNRQTEEVIRIYDQLPIPMNEDIKTELLSPEESKGSLGNDNKISWRLALQPGEKKNLPLKFQIKFPKDLRIYGLE